MVNVKESKISIIKYRCERLRIQSDRVTLVVVVIKFAGDLRFYIIYVSLSKGGVENGGVKKNIHLSQ